MHRSSRFILILAGTLALSGGTARSQPFGGPYGYGFGGWSSTVGGDVARGMGAAAAGVGSMRANTAAANSVNADTVMRYNQYLYSAQQERNRSYYESQVRRSNRTKESVNGIQDRITNNPSTSDIERGDALNAILDQLTNPKVLQGGALQRATGEIDSKLIKDIPFRNAAEAVTICISQLTQGGNIPEILKSDMFQAEAEQAKAAATEVRQQAEDGSISPEASDRLRAAVNTLYQKVKDTPGLPANQQSQALNYLKGLAGFVKVLENNDALQKLKELDQVKSTRDGNLIAFMYAYNLRFGPASTPRQKLVYAQLYPILKADRDRIMGQLGPGAESSPGSAPTAPPTEMFQGMDPSDLGVPSPPSPGLRPGARPGRNPR